MMSAEKIPAKPAAAAATTTKDESQSSSAGSRKATPAMRPPSEQALKCPRCDSPNTKFCYYNNYSLTQPRHFCKTCRRYWTKGGALRNVPIGGGCRKNKKMKSSSSRLSGDNSKEYSSGSSTDHIGAGLKFFPGLISPAMDFQLGGLSFPRLQPSTPSSSYNQFSLFGDINNPSTSTTPFGLDALGNSSTTTPLMGMLNFPLSQIQKQGDNQSGGFCGEVVQEMGSMNVHSSLASSIESLSSMNQDLHWKLQQQRLATLFGGESTQKESAALPLENLQVQKPQPIMFQNLEISNKPDVCEVADDSRRDQGAVSGNIATTEWFFDSSFAPSSSNNINGQNEGATSNVNWNGIQAWTDLNNHQFSTLP